MAVYLGRGDLRRLWISAEDIFNGCGVSTQETFNGCGISTDGNPQQGRRKATDCFNFILNHSHCISQVADCRPNVDHCHEQMRRKAG